MTSSRQRKNQPTTKTTNLLYVKRIERPQNAPGNIVRTVENCQRSSDSIKYSSDTLEDEEATTTTPNYNLRKGMLLILKGARSNPVIKAPSLMECTLETHLESIPKSSQNVSESSLTLSLPKDITTSWLKRKPASKSDIDLVKKTSPIKRPSLAEPGSRTTAKSIFSSNKFRAVDDKRSSVQDKPDVDPAMSFLTNPEFQAGVSVETSEYESNQFYSPHTSFVSYSDREFTSIPLRDPIKGSTETLDVQLASSALPDTVPLPEGCFLSSIYEEKKSTKTGRKELKSFKNNDLKQADDLSNRLEPINGETMTAYQDLNTSPESSSANADVTKREAPLSCSHFLRSRKYWSADVLPVSEWTEQPSTSKGMVSASKSQTLRETVETTSVIAFDENTMVKTPRLLNTSDCSSRMDDKTLENTVVPELFVREVDILCNAFVAPIENAGTSRPETLARSQQSPINTSIVENVHEGNRKIQLPPLISESSLEVAPEEVRKDVLGSRFASSSKRNNNAEPGSDTENRRLQGRDFPYELSETKVSEAHDFENQSNTEKKEGKANLKCRTSCLDAADKNLLEQSTWPRSSLQKIVEQIINKPDRKTNTTTGSDCFGQENTVRESVLVDDSGDSIADDQVNFDESQGEQPIAMSFSRGFQPSLTKDLYEEGEQSATAAFVSIETTVTEEPKAEGDSRVVLSRHPSASSFRCLDEEGAVPTSKK
ncbi:unnamed protein product, partial [Ixodes pacificus]